VLEWHLSEDARRQELLEVFGANQHSLQCFPSTQLYMRQTNSGNSCVRIFSRTYRRIGDAPLILRFELSEYQAYSRDPPPPPHLHPFYLLLECDAGQTVMSKLMAAVVG